MNHALVKRLQSAGEKITCLRDGKLQLTRLASSASNYDAVLLQRPPAHIALEWLSTLGTIVDNLPSRAWQRDTAMIWQLGIALKKHGFHAAPGVRAPDVYCDRGSLVDLICWDDRMYAIAIEVNWMSSQWKSCSKLAKLQALRVIILRGKAGAATKMPDSIDALYTLKAPPLPIRNESAIPDSPAALI